MSIEFVIAVSELRDTNPLLYGGMVGFCIGAAFVIIAFGIMALIEHHTRKKEKKMLNATDLLGEEVVYDGGSVKIEGQVVSIDYDLTEFGLETTVYIDVGMGEYFRVDYGGKFKNIHLKGAEDEQSR